METSALVDEYLAELYKAIAKVSLKYQAKGVEHVVEVSLSNPDYTATRLPKGMFLVWVFDSKQPNMGIGEGHVLGLLSVDAVLTSLANAIHSKEKEKRL